MTDNSAAFLFGQVKQLRYLTTFTVDLRKNKIYHKIVPDIEKAVKTMGKLEELHMYLGQNYFLPSSKAEMKKSFRKLPLLTSVSIKI